MSKQSQERPNWGLSYGELVWRRFRNSRLNMACLIFVAFLLLLAVFAPFLASDRPFIVRIDGPPCLLPEAGTGAVVCRIQKTE